MVCYDCLNFELVSIRLKGHTCSDNTFDVILILCLSFIENMKAFCFQ
jgi:hypothetical protein